MESLEREIAAIERSVSAGPRHRESLESSLGEVNEGDLPQTKDVDDGVRHGDGEQEVAEIIEMAEGTSGILELPMEVADVDEMAVLDRKLAMRVCGVDKGDDSAWKTAETPARAPT